MKKWIILLSIILFSSTALAYDFSYVITDPSAPEAEDHIASKTNVEVKDEGDFVYWKQDVGATSLEESEPGTIIYQFNFPKPIAKGNFFTRITTFHWSYSKGHSFIYLSVDGEDWIKLAEAEPPADNGGYNIQTYNDALPSQFIGADQVWIKVELNSYGARAPSGGAMTNTAQHLRYQKSVNNTTFKIEVDYATGTDTDTDTDTDFRALTIPATTQTYDYTPIVSPVTGSDPAVIKPMSIGSAAESGPQFVFSVSLNAFNAPVDLYLGLLSTALDPNEIYLFDEEGYLIAMSQAGLRAWKHSVTTSFDETLISLPAVSLPEGAYSFFLMATSADQFEPYLFWTTSYTRGDSEFFVDQYISAVQGGVIEASGVRLRIPPNSLPEDTAISAFSVPAEDMSGDEILGGIRFSPNGVELESMALVEVPIFLPDDWTEDELISIYEFHGDDPSLSTWNGYHAAIKIVDGQTVAVAPVFHFSGVLFVRNCHSGTFKYLLDQFKSYGCDPNESIDLVKKKYPDFGGITINTEKIFDKNIQRFLFTSFEEKYTFNPNIDIPKAVIDEMLDNLNQKKLVVLAFHEGAWPAIDIAKGELYGTFMHTAVLEKKNGKVQIRNSANLSDDTASKLMDAMGGTNLVYSDWDKINQFRELQTGVAVELACGLQPGQLGAAELNPFGIKCYGLLNGKNWTEVAWENLSDNLITFFANVTGIAPRPRPWRAVKIYVQKESLDDLCDDSGSPGTCAEQGIPFDEVISCYSENQWQQCGDGEGYIWDDANVYCSNLVLDGYSDWRLPTLRNFLDDGSCIRQAFEDSDFYDTYGYWTSDLSVSKPGRAMEYDFFGPNSYARLIETKYRVRCVR